VGAADVGARAPADFEAVSTADSVVRAAADLEVPAWPTPEVDAMAAAGCKRVGAAARPPADFKAVGYESLTKLRLVLQTRICQKKFSVTDFMCLFFPRSVSTVQPLQNY
jgi:hypothetical protein